MHFVEARRGGVHRMSFFDADSSKRSREPPPTRRAVRRSHSRAGAEMTAVVATQTPSNSPGLRPRACQTWFSMGTERAFLMYALSSPLVVYMSLSLLILLHLGFVLRRLAFKFLLRVLLRFAFASLTLCSCFALALLWICFCVPLALLSFCFRFAFALL